MGKNKRIHPKVCEFCGKDFLAFHPFNRFCSKKCVGNSTRIGFHKEKRGYVKILFPNGKQEWEHRIVAAQMLGRPLKRNEHVHHKNENKSDNRPENLEVLGASEHRRQHMILPEGQWSRKHNCCVSCGTTEIPHNSNGNCRRCHNHLLYNERRLIYNERRRTKYRTNK